jgi:hypothetical protein
MQKFLKKDLKVEEGLLGIGKEAGRVGTEEGEVGWTQSRHDMYIHGNTTVKAINLYHNMCL